jgi:hypothetical protein
VPTVPQVVVSGRTEVLGDYVVNCAGINGVVQADITVTLNTNVTNALANGVTDAVLTVNGGSAQSGIVVGYNSLRWAGVFLTAGTNGTATVQISKVRADASQLLTQGHVVVPGNPQPTAITGQIGISGVPVSNGVQTMATAVQALVFTRGSASGGAQSSIPLIFQEAQANSFQPIATRLHVALTNLPSNVQVYAPVYPSEGASRAQLYSTNPSGVGGSPVVGIAFAGGTYQQLIPSSGTVTATWVVLSASSSVVESFTFPLLVLNASSADLDSMQVSGSLGPVSDVGVASATAPVPRYRDFSVTPKLSNLRVTASAQVPAAGGTAKAHSQVGKALELNPAATVGSNVTVVTQFVNDTADPNQTATNVVVRNNLSSGLSLVSCTTTVGACSAGQVQVGTLAPGQGGTVTVVAQVSPSFTGGVLEDVTTISSDQVNLDLLAGTSGSSLIIQNPTPTVLPVLPASGTQASGNFQFQFTDPAGWQNLGVVNVLINNFLDGKHACYLAYVVSSKSLVLVDDAGDGGGPYAGSLAPGTAGNIQNSQCAISQLTATGSGNLLILSMNIAFKTSFGGNKITYLAARDQAGLNSNWQPLGVWQAPWTPTGTITVQGLNLTSATANPVTFTATLSDSKGVADFGVVNVLINGSLDARQGCYLAYVVSTNTLVLVNDAGDAGGNYAGIMPLNGGTATIQNSQCKVSAFGSSAVRSGTTLTLTLNTSFYPGFTGNKITWLAGRDTAGGNNTDWQAMATWAGQ